MCYHSDLFGDVIVTLDDVELWLDVVPRHLSNSPNSRIRYAKNYDVASKIKAAKINGNFYLMDGNDFKHAFQSAKSLYHPNYISVLQQKSQSHRLTHLIGSVT
jgi:hypothetical protein